MKPNSPHAVYTTNSAICYGGHFYCSATIRNSIFGIYHTFCAATLLTNTEHTVDSCLLLRRMLVYTHYLFARRAFDATRPTMPTPHVPDVSTFDGAMDMFMLCIIMEFGSLLNPWAYCREV